MAEITETKKHWNKEEHLEKKTKVKKFLATLAAQRNGSVLMPPSDRQPRRRAERAHAREGDRPLVTAHASWLKALSKSHLRARKLRRAVRRQAGE